MSSSGLWMVALNCRSLDLRVDRSPPLIERVLPSGYLSAWLLGDSDGRTSRGDLGHRLASRRDLILVIDLHGSCYRTVCSLDSRWMKRGQSGVTEPIPPTVTSMGRFFLFREVRPRETSPVTWGFEKARV
jgi:hypothetical protein